MTLNDTKNPLTGYKLRPTAEPAGMTLHFEFTHMPRKIRALKKRKDLSKQTYGVDHLDLRWMMGCGFNFQPASHQRRRSFSFTFFKPNLETSAQPFIALKDWVEAEGLSDDILINRRLYDPSGSGSYRIPDAQIPSAHLILDGTIGTKYSTTPQILDFMNWPGGRVQIINPTITPVPGYLK